MYVLGLRRWRPSKWQARATCGCIAAQVKVHVSGLDLLSPRLNGSPLCDDSAAEDGMRICGAYK